MGTLETFANVKDRSTIIEFAPLVKQQQPWGLKRVAQVGSGAGAAAAAHGRVLTLTSSRMAPESIFISTG